MEIVKQISTILESQPPERRLYKMKEYAASLEFKTSPVSTTSSITDSIVGGIFSNRTLVWNSQKQFEELSKAVDELLRHPNEFGQLPNPRNYIKKAAKIRVILAETLGRNSKMYKWHVGNAGPTTEEYTAANERMHERRDVRLSHVVSVPFEQVRSAMNQLLSSDDILDKILAIQLACGARTIEAVKLSNFEKVSWRNKDQNNLIRVVGIAKSKKTEVYHKRGRDPAGADEFKSGGAFFSEEELVRPLLFLNASEFLQLVKNTRFILEQKYHISELSNTEINTVFASRLIRRVKKLGLEGIKSAHDMRKLYAAATHEDEDVDSAKHVKDVLGQKSYDSTMSYMNVKVSK
jgi:hypothetical protein